MKTPIVILIVLGSLIVPYLMISFAQMDMNAAHWDVADRKFSAVFTLIICAAGINIYAINKLKI